MLNPTTMRNAIISSVDAQLAALSDATHGVISRGRGDGVVVQDHKIGPVVNTKVAFRKISLDADEIGEALGRQFGQGLPALMISSSLISAPPAAPDDGCVFMSSIDWHDHGLNLTAEKLWEISGATIYRHDDLKHLVIVTDHGSLPDGYSPRRASALVDFEIDPITVEEFTHEEYDELIRLFGNMRIYITQR